MITHIATSALMDVLPDTFTVDGIENKTSSWNFQKRPGMLYVAARAVSVGTNGNADHFTYDELKTAWPTFIGKGVFVNHQSSDIEAKRGKIVDAKFIDNGDSDSTYVICLMEVNAEAFPSLAEMIKAGMADSVSMGVRVSYSNCSICNHRAVTTKDYCFVPDTKITMYDGSLKNIQDINIGDVVLSAYGTLDEVIDVKSRHVDENIVQFSMQGSNQVLNTTEEHPMLAYKKDWSTCTQCKTPKSCTHMNLKNPKFISSDFLSIGDYLLTPINYSSGPVFDPELMELVGYYAAEGSISKRKGVIYGLEFNIHANEKETIGLRIKEIIKSKFDKDVKFYVYGNKCSVRLHNPEISSLIYNLCPGGAKTKTLNPQIFLSSMDSQIILLNAMVAGDGSYDSTHNTVIYRTSSENLRNQVELIGKNLGFGVTRYTNLQNGGPTNRKAKFLTNAVALTKLNETNTDLSGKLALLETKNNTWDFRVNNLIGYRIRSKKYVPYHGEVYNLETKETNSYLANTFAVHNCSHIKFNKGGVDGFRRVYEINHGLEFQELSFVSVGADSQAKVLEIIAKQARLHNQDVRQLWAEASKDSSFADKILSHQREMELTVVASMKLAKKMKEI